jgi:hypothetical protein
MITTNNKIITMSLFIVLIIIKHNASTDRVLNLAISNGIL